VTHTVTLVTDVYVSKREALRELSQLFGVDVNDSDPSNSVLDLGLGVVLSIEVPKFGEDLPLTIDLTGWRPEDVESVAGDVISRLGKELSWSVTIVPVR